MPLLRRPPIEIAVAREGGLGKLASIGSRRGDFGLRFNLRLVLAVAEAMGSLGWVGARGKSRMWVSQGFRREYHKAQAVKLAIIDAAYEACFLPQR